ncbi:MAG TPA: GNAT family N-acetyltransferase [Phycisphaerae bacterium]|jgi:GNAT superfamily N-acetyltransferase|nr:GNAT family N-acetyltransferase [Phycisphaerae bacterium]
MIVLHDKYEIDDAILRVDFPAVTAWLAASYWSPGILQARVEQGARNSTLVIGTYRDGKQVAFARVVSDTTRFAYLSDVIVDAAQQGKGIARAMVQFALTHPALAGVEKWFLRTEDAHGVYAPLGFAPITDSHFWMARHPKKG